MIEHRIERHQDDEYILPDAETSSHLGELLAAIDEAHEVALDIDGGQRVPLPPQIREGLTRMVGYLARGSAVSINPVDQYLSTQEVADLLGVSRPHVIELLQREKIPHERAGGPGTHRRIPLTEVLAYRERRAAEVAREGAERRQPRRERAGMVAGT